MESPGTPSSTSFPPLEQCAAENIAAAVESLKLGPAYADYAKKIVEQCIEGVTLVDFLESPNADDLMNQFLVELGVSLLAHRTRLKRLFKDMHPKAAAAAADRFPAPVHDGAEERALWLKACLILEACAKGVKPFVGQVMQHLLSRVIENVKGDVVRDLGACEGEEWDCSACHDADDPKFTENAPVALTIRTMDSNGVTDCGVAHELKPHALKPCRLKSIPASCCPDFEGASPSLPLLLCPNPADMNPESSTFLLLHCSQPISTEPHLTPFVVTRCEPSGPALQFHVVLCCSRPGHTAQLVQSFLSQQPLPIFHANDRGEFPKLSFAFWSLQSRGKGFKEVKHGMKKGHILRFDGGEKNLLPPGIKRGSRYLVTDATDFCFKICGPILTPMSPLTSKSYPGDPLVVIRRSPIGRLRDAARLFHSRGMSEVHWSGIRAERLSSHHGEFCKLFCSQTSRQVDFFSDGGAQSGEQLLNMIGMCTAFSLGNQVLSIDVLKGSPSKPFNCTVHSSPPVLLSVVASSNNPSDSSATKPAKAQPMKLWTGCMSEAGGWERDERRLQADTMVSFSDAGCGLPLNIHTGCRYQPTCIGTGSFQLLRPTFCSLFDVDCSSLNDLKSSLDKVKKGAAGQPISKDLKDLLTTDPSNHAALKLALERVQEGPVDCEIAKYLRRIASVDRENHTALKCALEDLKKALVGQQELREPGVIDFRNRLAHNLLTLEAHHFEALVACARTMFAGVCSTYPFLSMNADDCNFAKQSLAEIESIVDRDSSFQGLVSSLTDHERDVVAREHERMREERDRLKDKLGRKFDSLSPCLKKDIQDQLIESKRIGASGGQGTVYRVKHWQWGQPLAVKVFHVFHDAAKRLTWRQELNSLTFLSHANIVRMMYIVYETLDDRSQCRAPVGYAMELMALSAADRRDYTLDQLLNVFVQIASALVFSHEHDVIHFDIKPENILLDESCSVAKLCDFGCAHKLKSASSSTTASVIQGQMRGTDLYMAPEVFRGHVEDAPKLCDIFSFGKTMWKLLHPTRAVELNRVFPVDADVPPALKELVEQCTMDDPASRPQDMAQVLQRLQSVSQSYHNPSTDDNYVDVLSMQRVDDTGSEYDPCQTIEDLGLELSKPMSSQAPAADSTWGGHLVVTESGKAGFVLRVSHDALRALEWQVDVQVKVSGPHFKVNSSCVLSNLGVLGNAQTVIYPGCTLDSSPPSSACTAFIVTQIRKDSQILPNADHDAVVEVSLGSPSIISVVPSEDMLSKPKLLEWFKKVGYGDDDAGMCVRECAEQMNYLWQKGVAIMKMAQDGVRPFVKLVMRQLQQAVVNELKTAGKPWDCSVGPEKMDLGPDEIHVTSINQDGVFLCEENHEFQTSYDSCDPTALQVVSPCDELAAAGLFDGQVIYVCRSATRALGEAAFKCQKSPSTHLIEAFLKVFKCTVHSSPPVTFSVMSSEYDPTYPRAAAFPAAASPPVKIWTVAPNAKKAGFFIRDAQKLSEDFDVSFADIGSGLPSGIVSGRLYQLACVTPASFELMPELISVAPDWNSDEKPLLLRRVETPQRCFRAHALKHHQRGEAAVVHWAGIKVQNLSKNVDDFAKLFCSGTKDDIFETETRGELLFNMMTFCKEFLYFHNFLSTDSCWTMRYSSFSQQPYWFNSSTLEVSTQEPRRKVFQLCTRLKDLSAQASSTRSTLMHADFEITIPEFERTCEKFLDLLEEIIKICNTLLANDVIGPDLRSEVALAMRCAQDKINDILKRRLSRGSSTTLQEQREESDLRKQYQKEKQRAEHLEQQMNSLLPEIDRK